jgi:hypothetical protein
MLNKDLPRVVAFMRGLARGWLENDTLVDGRGVQSSALGYPHLARTEIFESVETFYRRFYFRPRKIFQIAGEMARDTAVMRRRLKEGVEFLGFLRRRRAGQ